MSIEAQLLGRPGRDNALLVSIDRGQGRERLLFDCGGGCLDALSVGEIQGIRHLAFSHLHMDHVAGFDTFLRINHARGPRPNQIWGPPETARILQHRFQGFMWNLTGELQATWLVHELGREMISTSRFELGEAFARRHASGARSAAGPVLEEQDFTLTAISLDHGIPSMGYLVREKPHRNISSSRLADLGLKPGPWLQAVQDPQADLATIEIQGRAWSLVELRERLVVERPGDSLAYLTDFHLRDEAMADLAGALSGCRLLFCESQYRQEDRELARRNFHMTSVLAARLARLVDPEELVLFHVSDRYERSGWQAMLDEARAVFPRTRFPEGWELG